MVKKFGSWLNLPAELLHAARVAVNRSLRIQPGERVLIVTNPVETVSTISFALHDAAMEAGATAVVAYQQPKTQFDFCDEAIVAALDTAPDVFISLSSERLGKDRKAIEKPYQVGERQYDSGFHYLLHGIKKIRGFWSPRVTVDSFIRTVPIDYERLKEECLAVKKALDGSVALRITNRNGTDISLGIAGRNAFIDDGDFSLPGRGGNLPAGESFVSPVVGSSEGTIVFDGSIASHEGEILIKNSIVAQVEGGFLTSVSGGEEAKKLLDSITQGEENAYLMEKQGRLKKGMGAIYARNARNIGELGIGLNPRARITGNMLEDEKVAGTCHFALGSNYDEDAPSLIHLDGLVEAPTITAILPGGGTKEILREGELLIAP